MTEAVVLLPEPDPERDEKIFKQWKAGKRTIVQLARDYNLPQTQITAALDRMLPSLMPQAQARELRRLLYDLEELREAYHDIAMTENDSEAANVSIRTAHEIAQLRQFIGGSAHTPVQLQQAGNPNAEKSTAAWERGIALLCSSATLSPEGEAEVRELSKHKDPPEDEDQQT